jgi:2,5-dichloro-2,5-cyclohexadiene-1,4-diol dehydrogenase 1
MLGLEKKSALVTGGGSGIGRATALLLAEAGAYVVVADLNAARAEETAALIKKAGGNAVHAQADVRDEAQVAAMVKKSMDAFGGLDCAANCAGFPQHSALLHETSSQQWQDCMDINLTGAFFCMKHQISAMLAGKGGAIVMISSTVAVRGFPRASEYAASKAGLLALVRCAASEYGKQGIRINTVLPGGTETPMLRSKLSETAGADTAFAALHMLGRFGRPEELGASIRWLLSEEASFITGAAIPVDGGLAAA